MPLDEVFTLRSILETFRTLYAAKPPSDAPVRRVSASELSLVRCVLLSRGMLSARPPFGHVAGIGAGLGGGTTCAPIPGRS